MFRVALIRGLLDPFVEALRISPHKNYSDRVFEGKPVMVI